MKQLEQSTVIAVVLICCVLGLGVIFIYGLQNNDATPSVSEPHKVAQRDKDVEPQEVSSMAAWEASKSYVLDKLKAPSTASFPWFDFTLTRGTENHFYLKSYVDSENSFGAKIRIKFAVSLTSSDGKNFHVDLVAIEDSDGKINFF